MTIAIPDNPFYIPLVANIDQIASQYGLKIVRTSESHCAKMLFNNQASVALTTPIGYGLGVVQSDYRIIPTYACVLEGWTNT